jgi:hypothetical protein
MARARTRKSKISEDLVETAAPPRETAVTTPAAELTGASINASFRRDAGVRKALTSHLQELGALRQETAQRAKDAFSRFDTNRLSDEERALTHYLPPGGDVKEALARIIQEDTDAIRDADASRSIGLRLSDVITSMIQPAAGDGGLVGRIDLDALRRFIDQRIATHVYRKEIYTACEAEVEANGRMAQIEAPEGGGGAAAPPAPGPTSPAVPDADAATLVKEHVNLQMATATSPESRLAYNVQSRATRKEAQASIQTFELRDGPSDVVAFHDFNNLQIAFHHVWTEIFDGRLRELGELLYAEFVRLDALNRPDPRYPPISTVDELKNLLADIRKLALQIDEAVPDEAAGAIRTFDGKHGVTVPLENTTVNTGTGTVTANPDKGRLFTLLESIEKILATKYAFHVFAENSINFGIMVTYRQTWQPLKYQVGDLVSTIPLAPKEMRRYTTRVVTKKTRNRKELEDSLRTQRTESSDTKRVDAEIVEKAQNKTTFNVMAHEAIGGDEGYKVDSTQTFGNDAASESSKTKKEFREHVMKSAQEYKEQHRTEIDTSESTESEGTTFHEIQNPNDELTVTYLFYELQRQYEISEQIHKLTPVILVANAVPRPDEITDAWLMEHDWILRRVILDDSFRPALEYLDQSFVGAELNIRILENNAVAQQQVVAKLNQQIQTQMTILSADEKAVVDAIAQAAGATKEKGVLDTVKRIFDPIGITGQTSSANVDAAQTTVDYAKETLDNAIKEKARLLSELNVATSALQMAVDKLSNAVKEHYNHVTQIDRLRVHVKDNILYYMQAIWSHEPPDQRFFRIYQIPVPDVQANTAGVPVNIYNASGVVLPGTGRLRATIPMPAVSSKPKRLVEVADLDSLLGFKGNYMIFPLKKNNYITMFMMQDYLELADEITARDPDPYGDYSVDDLQRLATCLKKKDETLYEENKRKIKQAIIDRLTSSRKDKELVVVPTSSLYIEALVGTHPLLEDFKLIHRALDVKKVQAEVRHAELENIRLAARALRGKDDDPDIDKKIVIEGGAVDTVIPGE